MKKPTELNILLKAFVMITAAAFCVMGLAIGSFAAKNNSEYVSTGSKTEYVYVATFFPFK